MKVGALLARCMNNDTVYRYVLHAFRLRSVFWLESCVRRAMQMEDMFNVSSLEGRLNNFNITEKIDNIKVDLTKTEVFDEETERQLNNSISASTVDFGAYVAQLGVWSDSCVLPVCLGHRISV